MDLLAIEPSKIESSIRGKNFLFYGGPGTWKTTVASKFPHVLLAATENGYKFIDGVYAVMIHDWREAKAFVREVKRPEVQEKFWTLAFDRTDTLYQMCYNYVLNANGATSPSDPVFNGSGWDKIAKEWTSFINSLEVLGYGLVFICHDKDNDKDVEDTGALKIDLQRTGLKPIRGICDFIFNIVREENPETGEIQCFANSNSTSARTKKRARYFPDKVLFTYDKIQEELDKAIKTQCEIDGIEAQIYEKKKTEQRSYADLYQAVVSKVQELQSTDSPNLLQYATTQNVVLQGKKLGEISQDDRYYDQLLVLETYLTGLN